MVLTPAEQEAIHAQAVEEYPFESCGVILARGSERRLLRCRNAQNELHARDPVRYTRDARTAYYIDPKDLLRLTIEADEADHVFWGIVHSHTHTPARPSPTDIGLAFYPDALYILVSLSPDEIDPATGMESLRAWRILDGAVYEVGLQLEG